MEGADSLDDLPNEADIDSSTPVGIGSADEAEKISRPEDAKTGSLVEASNHGTVGDEKRLIQVRTSLALFVKCGEGPAVPHIRSSLLGSSQTTELKQLGVPESSHDQASEDLLRSILPRTHGVLMSSELERSSASSIGLETHQTADSNHVDDSPSTSSSSEVYHDRHGVIDLNTDGVTDSSLKICAKRKGEVDEATAGDLPGPSKTRKVIAKPAKPKLNDRRGPEDQEKRMSRNLPSRRHATHTSTQALKPLENLISPLLSTIENVPGTSSCQGSSSSVPLTPLLTKYTVKRKAKDLVLGDFVTTKRRNISNSVNCPTDQGQSVDGCVFQADGATSRTASDSIPFTDGTFSAGENSGQNRSLREQERTMEAQQPSDADSDPYAENIPNCTGDRQVLAPLPGFSQQAPALGQCPGSREQERIVQSQQPSDANVDTRVESMTSNPTGATRLQTPSGGFFQQWCHSEQVQSETHERIESSNTYIFHPLTFSMMNFLSITFYPPNGEHAVEEVMIHLISSHALPFVPWRHDEQDGDGL